MCILLTPVLYFITTVIIELYLHCFIESVSLRDIGKPTSRAEISSHSSLYHKVVKGAYIGSSLTGATSEADPSWAPFFQLDRYRPFAFQHESMVYNPRDH